MSANPLNLMKNSKSEKLRVRYLYCNFKTLSFVLTVVVTMSLAGCSSPKRVVYTPQAQSGMDVAGDLPAVCYPDSGTALDPDKRYVAALLKLYVSNWRGTPYRRGGMSHRGIDCSGFTLLTYRDLFGLDLPRTTSEQAGRGEKIKKIELVPGDLVFFKTGVWQKHVGICIGGTRFVHASYSKGVTVSSLEDDYWRSHFWQARRLSTNF